MASQKQTARSETHPIVYNTRIHWCHFIYAGFDSSVRDEDMALDLAHTHDRHRRVLEESLNESLESKLGDVLCTSPPTITAGASTEVSPDVLANNTGESIAEPPMGDVTTADVAPEVTTTANSAGDGTASTQPGQVTTTTTPGQPAPTPVVDPTDPSLYAARTTRTAYLRQFYDRAQRKSLSDLFELVLPDTVPSDGIEHVASIETLRRTLSKTLTYVSLNGHAFVLVRVFPHEHLLDEPRCDGSRPPEGSFEDEDPEDATLLAAQRRVQDLIDLRALIANLTAQLQAVGTGTFRGRPEKLTEEERRLIRERGRLERQLKADIRATAPLPRRRQARHDAAEQRLELIVPRIQELNALLSPIRAQLEVATERLSAIGGNRRTNARAAARNAEASERTRARQMMGSVDPDATTDELATLLEEETPGEQLPATQEEAPPQGQATSSTGADGPTRVGAPTTGFISLYNPLDGSPIATEAEGEFFNIEASGQLIQTRISKAGIQNPRQYLCDVHTTGPTRWQKLSHLKLQVKPYGSGLGVKLHDEEYGSYRDKRLLAILPFRDERFRSRYMFPRAMEPFTFVLKNDDFNREVNVLEHATAIHAERAVPFETMREANANPQYPRVFRPPGPRPRSTEIIVEEQIDALFDRLKELVRLITSDMSSLTTAPELTDKYQLSARGIRVANLYCSVELATARARFIKSRMSEWEDPNIALRRAWRARPSSTRGPQPRRVPKPARTRAEKAAQREIFEAEFDAVSANNQPSTAKMAVYINIANRIHDVLYRLDRPGAASPIPERKSTSSGGG